jgi:hypothetical protein
MLFSNNGQIRERNYKKTQFKFYLIFNPYQPVFSILHWTWETL